MRAKIPRIVAQRSWPILLFRTAESAFIVGRGLPQAERVAEARELVRAVYGATSAYPSSEMYGLVAQSRRAAVGIPANIAEGSGRGTAADYAHFVDFAVGSACELETLIILAADLGFVRANVSESLQGRIRRERRMLIRFRQQLRRAG